uniref:Uncharacterized protein n=1 Tax=Anguilla anguilla TaxID=7936 RepID=A0A0E9RHQ3_ANGAN
MGLSRQMLLKLSPYSLGMNISTYDMITTYLTKLSRMTNVGVSDQHNDI